MSFPRIGVCMHLYSESCSCESFLMLSGAGGCELCDLLEQLSVSHAIAGLSLDRQASSTQISLAPGANFKKTKRSHQIEVPMMVDRHFHSSKPTCNQVCKGHVIILSLFKIFSRFIREHVLADHDHIYSPPINWRAEE